MTNNYQIRQTTSADMVQVLELYPQAFPEEDLRAVVSALIGDETKVMSLATFEGDALVAHLLFTFCKTHEQGHTGALLAPLGVMPTHQRQGLGGALVRDGLERLAQMQVSQVFVLGDPAYYQRFGFATEKHVQTPYPLPAQYGDAWQSIPLARPAPLAAGRLILPEPWMDPALW